MYAQDIAFWADAMINADKPEHRLSASETFEQEFLTSLNQENSYYNKYNNLEWISIQYPQDSSFRILSWQIDRGDGDYIYQGFYQDQTRLVPFDPTNGDAGLDEDEPIEIKNWSGALVYRIVQIDDQYMLWTFRYLDRYNKVKTCEPFTMTGDKLTLGSAIFQEEENSPNYSFRHIMQYSADMNATLDFNADSQRIIFDNLVMVGGRMEGQGIAYVADGSYRAYSYDNGKWIAIDKVFDQVLDRAPRQRKKRAQKDLFGKKG